VVAEEKIPASARVAIRKHAKIATSVIAVNI